MCVRECIFVKYKEVLFLLYVFKIKMLKHCLFVKQNKKKHIYKCEYLAQSKRRHRIDSKFVYISRHILASCFVLFSHFVLFVLSFFTRFALCFLWRLFFFCSHFGWEKLVVVRWLFSLFFFSFKLFTWFIGTLFEKFSFSFSLRHSNSFHSVPFHSARHWMFAFWFFALSDFYVHS